MCDLMFRGRRMRLFHFLFALPVVVWAQIQTSSVLVSSKINSSKDTFSNETLVLENMGVDSTGLLVQKLAQVPGVFVNQTGGPGSQATVHIRGSEFRHVLVLIDGVRVNDASSTSKEANINALNVGDITRVEIIKGTQSLLYGSDAIGGIINFITKEEIERNSISIMHGFSNQASLNQNINAAGIKGVLSYQYDQSEGISSFRKGDEDDAYINRNLHLKLNKNWNENVKSELLIKDNNQYTEFDNSASDEEGIYSKNHQTIYSNKLIGKNDNYSWSLRNSLNRNDRPNDFGSSEIQYEGIEQVNELIGVKELKGGKLLIGLENLNEEFTQSNVDREYAYINSLYVMYDWEKESYFGQVGLRASEHKSFGSFLSPGASLGKKVGDQILSTNIQRGFKAPSLYQLYGEDLAFGKNPNTDLDPESSWAYDVTYKLGSTFNASLFYTKIDDVILNSSTPENGDYLEVSGTEATYNFIGNDSTLSTSIGLFQYFNPDKDRMYKRPNERVVIDYVSFLSEKSELNVNFQFVGRRYDQNFNVSPSEDVKLKSYELVNTSYTYRQKNRNWTVGVDNVFNEFYESAFGYSVLAQTFYLRLQQFY